MSRTDKTQPFLVALWSGTLARVERHNHIKGYCDLPATYADEVAQRVDPAFTFRDSCYWDFHYTGTNICACPMCSSQDWHRAQRRADRHKVRRALRDEVKHVRADGDQ